MPPEQDSLENTEAGLVETGEQEYEGYEGEPEAGEAGEAELGMFLRDISEDDAYQRLQRVSEFPDYINGLESRFSGNVGEVQNRLASLEKSLQSRSTFDGDKIAQVLNDYDPKLAEVLVPALQEALQIAPLDETTLRPHLEPMQNQLLEQFGQQLVMSVYPPETLAEIIPPVKEGRFAPEGQRHKDFIDWYSQQGYQTQQALLSFGAPYVNALRKFESWEQNKNKDRTQAAGNRSSRLAQGQVPTAQSRRTRGAGAQSPEDVFLAAFEEARSEG